MEKMLILSLLIIYFSFGLLVLIQILIWIMVFLLSNLLIGINPFSKELYIIRLISILVIIFILYYNYNSSYQLSCLLPLSIDKITYVNNINKNIVIDSNYYLKHLNEFNDNEIFDFLDNLSYDDNYIVSLEYILDISKYTDEGPNLILSKPFLINRYSSQTTITKFINERIELMIDLYYLDDSIFYETNKIGPKISLSYSKFYLASSFNKYFKINFIPFKYLHKLKLNDWYP